MTAQAKSRGQGGVRDEQQARLSGSEKRRDAPREDAATMRKAQRRRPKVFHEEVKTHHTSHWDWDYLSRRELDGVLKSQESMAPRDDRRPGRLARGRRSVGALLLLSIAAGLVLGNV